MPKPAAVTEARKAIEGSPVLQSKLAGFAPPDENGETPKIIQTDEDEKKKGIKKSEQGEEQIKESGEQREERGDSEESRERGDGKRSFRRENPFEKKRREAEEAKSEAGVYKEKATAAEARAATAEAALEEAKAKLAEAGNAGERKEANAEIEKAHNEMQKANEAWQKERADLIARVEFHDLRESPRFQAEYVRPCVEAFKEISEFIGDDENVTQAFQAFLNANESTLSTTGAESAHWRNQRGTLISQIMENMPQYNRVEFQGLITDFIAKTKKQSEALKSWEPTRQRLMQEAQEQNREAQVKHKNFWDNMFKETGIEVDSQIPKNETLEKIIAEHKIPLNEDEDMSIARGCMTDAKISERDVTRILNQGRAFSRSTAYLKGALIQIKELEAALAKARGGNPGNMGDRSGETEPSRNGPTLADKFARHRHGAVVQ